MDNKIFALDEEVSWMIRSEFKSLKTIPCLKNKTFLKRLRKVLMK